MMEIVAVSSAGYGVVFSMIICVAAIAIFTSHILLLIVVVLTIGGKSVPSILSPKLLRPYLIYLDSEATNMLSTVRNINFILNFNLNFNFYLTYVAISLSFIFTPWPGVLLSFVLCCRLPPVVATAPTSFNRLNL